MASLMRWYSWRCLWPMASSCFRARAQRPRQLLTSSLPNVVRSPLEDVKIPSATPFHSYIYRAFQKFGDRTAIEDGLSGRNYSFKQLEDLTKSVASGLVRRGLQKGDVLCVHLPNLPEFPLAFFGTMAGGGTASTANPAYTSRELAFQLKDCGAKFLVTTPESVDLAKEVAQDSGSLEEIFVIDVKQSDVPSGCTGFSQLMKDDGSALPSLQSTLFTKTDLAALPYSSGTTGLPKGVMLSHYNLLSNICQVTLPGLLKSRPEDKTSLAILPFFHAYGLAVILARDLEQGTKIVTMPKFEPEQYLKLLETHEVTRGFLVPPVMLFLAKHPMVDDYKLSSLTDLFSGAAPLSGEVTESIKKRLGITQVRQGYGLTETSPVTHLLPENVFKPGSVGIPVPNTECKVVDVESGNRSLGANERGELYIRGPQVMVGYWNNPKATQDSIDEDNWFHTGDIGYYDSDHYFYITDRVKELIKVKGYQVPPAELEALLVQHPDITDAAVIGVLDEQAGEVPMAFVVQRQGSNLSVESVLNYVSGQVAPYKELAGGVKFVDSIPKSASGKILRRLLRDQEAA